MHELSELSGLSVAEKDALMLALYEQVKQVERLTATVQALSARVRELEIPVSGVVNATAAALRTMSRRLCNTAR